MRNTAVKTTNVSLTHGQAALRVGCPGRGIPAQPQSRMIAFALSHIYTSRIPSPLLES